MQYTSTLITLISVLAAALPTATANPTPFNARSPQAPGNPPVPSNGTYLLGGCQTGESSYGYSNFCPTDFAGPEYSQDYYEPQCDPNAQCTSTDNACEWVVGNQYASCS